MSDTNELSFSKYDSSNFAAFPDSIKHSKTNPLLIENLSDHRSIIMDNRLVKVQETNCLFKDMIHFFDPDLISADLPREEHYRPEITARRLYGSTDLWYVLLLVNNVYSITQYNMDTFKYIPALKLTKIEKFVARAEGNIRPYDERDQIPVILD